VSCARGSSRDLGSAAFALHRPPLAALTVVQSSGRTSGLVFGIKEPVQMDDEITHMGVVHALLRLGLPCRVGRIVIGVYPHNVECIEITEGGGAKLRQFTTENQVQKLFVSVTCGHGRLLNHVGKLPLSSSYPVGFKPPENTSA